LRQSDLHKPQDEKPVAAAEKRNKELNHSKIRRYIERQKKQAQAKKSMKETIEHEKHVKVKESLLEL
jgi:hypothetical protein